MRRITLLFVLAALTLVTIVQAQETDWPRCTAAELAALPPGLSEVTAFFESVQSIRTLDDLLAYSHAHIEWRERFWSNTPLCASAFEIYMLANQLIGDYVALIILNSYPGELEANPYSVGQDSGAARLQVLMNELPPPANSVDAPPARTLRDCTRAEREFVSSSLLPEYGSLTDIANDIETPEDYLRYVQALLTWRQNSLSSYPPCAEAIEFAWLASQTAADISALIALDFMRVPEDANPYSEPERQGTRRLGELGEELRAVALPDEVMQAIARELGTPGGGNWRRCSVDELETIENMLPTYQSLEDMAAGIKTLDDLLNYSHSQIEWRENLLAKLARCGEVLEIAWLISENIGDLAIMYALQFIDVPVDESPVRQQVMSNIPGISIWEQTLPSLLSAYEEKPVDSALPACSESELDTLAEILFEHLSIFKNRGYIRSSDSLLKLIEEQLSWREFGWSQLPLCYGSFEIFLRSYWFASDNAVGVALELADVPNDANPYPEQQAIGKSHIESWYAIVDGIEAAPSADRESIAAEKSQE